jgi:hypothetical protein
MAITTEQKIKLAKDGIKLLLGLGTTILLGTIYKVGKQTDEKIDAYFDEKYPTPEDEATQD